MRYLMKGHLSWWPLAVQIPLIKCPDCLISALGPL
jgi:hypothetical protein